MDSLAKISGRIFKKAWKTNNRCLHHGFLKIKRKEPFVSGHDLKAFMFVFPTLVNDLSRSIPQIPQFKDNFEKLFYCNVSNRKQKSLMLLTAYRELEKQENTTNEDIKLANILAWCIEMLRSSAVIQEEIMNTNEICPRMKETKQAIDAKIIREGIYLILKKYFSSHSYYVQFLESFRKMDMLTRMEQTLERLYMEDGLQSFNMENYYKLTKYKTYHSFTLPIVMAMYLSDKYHTCIHEYEEAKPICYELGKFYKIDNDFKNCFGYSTIGSDIRQGRFTWLVCLALQKGTREQRKLLETHYGRNKQESEVAVFNLYNQLCVFDNYKTIKKESYNYVLNRIEHLPPSPLQKVFYNYAEELYKW